MRWHVFAIGKPKLDFARLGVEEYVGRLKPFVPTEIGYLKASSQPAESSVLLERSKSMFRIVLDERGEHLGSRGWAKKLNEWELHSKRDLALIIAGDDGQLEEL